MSNYSIVTNFLSKDSLISGNPLKLVKGADLTTEFTAVQTALNSKFDGVVQFAPDGTAAQPSFGFTNNAGTGMFNAAGVLGFATGAASRLTISAAGAVVFNAPTSGVALTANGLAGQYTAQFLGSSTSGQSLGPLILAGTTSGDYALNVNNQANSHNFLRLFGDGSGQLGYNGTGSTLTWSATGNFTANAATSTASAFGSYSFNIAAPTAAGTSFGLYIKAGTNNTDRPFTFNNAADSLSLLQLLGDGTFIVGQPTSGQSGGFGSLNCGTLFVAGVPVYSNVPFHSVSGSYTPVLADAAKTLDCLASTAITLPLNASVAYPIGTVITILADFGSGSMTVAAGAGDTLFLGGSIGTTGTRTIAPIGLATVLRLSTTQWVINGSGVT